MGVKIEAGHCYLYPDVKGEPVGFTFEQQAGVDLAMRIAIGLGLPAQFLFFVDDLHGNPSLNIEGPKDEILKNLHEHSIVQKALEAFHKYGVEPELVSELSLTGPAAHLYNSLRNRGVVSRGGRNLVSELGGTALLTKYDQLTCATIDSAFYLRKIGLSQNEPTVTILPIRYKQQQEQVKNILSALGVYTPPITVIYHDEKGSILNQESWGRKLRI